ncbi:MAG TPA: hypothetical protein VNB24_00475 [Acidimicrobiales bacterium]|nr:hypothetical protein [Acidimicrobiales bacterium]
MTLAENPAKATILDFRDPRILVARSGPTVHVSVRNREVNPELVRGLRHVLLDLIAGQGNLSISVELPDVIALDTDLLDVLLEAAQHLVSRRGVLSVRTAVGKWQHPSQPPDAIA